MSKFIGAKKFSRKVFTRHEAHGLRHAFLPTIVPTSGRIHSALLRLLYLLADRKTTRFVQALGVHLGYAWLLGSV